MRTLILALFFLLTPKAFAVNITTVIPDDATWLNDLKAAAWEQCKTWGIGVYDVPTSTWTLNKVASSPKVTGLTELQAANQCPKRVQDFFWIQLYKNWKGDGAATTAKNSALNQANTDTEGIQ